MDTTISTTETYNDPRVKAAAFREHADMPYLSRPESQNNSMTVPVYVFTEFTEYGNYTRETVYTPRPSAEQPATTSEPNSWKRKFSLPAPIKKAHSEKKRPADLMDEEPSPQRSPGSGSKRFFPASYFHRPSIIRRNAWIGNPKREEIGEYEQAGATMTGIEQFALPGPALAVRDPQPEPAGTTQQRPVERINVSATQEERPRKMARLSPLASVPSL
jgi:hypothetical protein